MPEPGDTHRASRPAPDPARRGIADGTNKPDAAPLGLRGRAFAEQELRLISVLVLFIGSGLFLALPFVLSIGAVVFLPLTAAIMLTIMLSPLADWLMRIGLPNVFASLFALLLFLTLLVVALATVLTPAVALIDNVPEMMRQIGQRFGELRGSFAWLTEINNALTEVTGGDDERVVVASGPSMLESIAISTPSVVLEVLLTFLMAFFMIEARVRMRRRLLLERSDFSASVRAARVMRDVQDRVASYISTVAAINCASGVLVALAAWGLDLEAPVMWGGLAALLNFLPYIGPLVMVTLLTLFGVGTADTLLLGILPAALYLLLHGVEANVVTPSILGARFTMNPVLILIALSYFSWIWGIIGALLSVPILLSITALIEHLGRPNLIGFLFGEPLFNLPQIDETDGATAEG